MGKVLTDSAGHTLHAFVQDKDATSTCTDSCIATWPALTAPGKIATGSGLNTATSDEHDRRIWDFVRSRFGSGPLVHPSKWLASHGWHLDVVTDLPSLGDAAGRITPEAWTGRDALGVWFFEGSLPGQPWALQHFGIPAGQGRRFERTRSDGASGAVSVGPPVWIRRW